MGEQSPVALVTGADRGLGLELARQLAGRGYKVFAGLLDISHNPFEREMGMVEPIFLDVTSEASLAAGAESVGASAGHLDLLINNAGVSFDRLPPSLSRLPEARSTFDVNYFGVVSATQAFLPLLRRGSERSIVNITSETASMSLSLYVDFQFDDRLSLAYSASKAAVNLFTIFAAKELSGEGFRVNAISPGLTATGLTDFNRGRSVEASAQAILDHALSTTGTGGFILDGRPLPW